MRALNLSFCKRYSDIMFAWLNQRFDTYDILEQKTTLTKWKINNLLIIWWSSSQFLCCWEVSFLTTCPLHFLFFSFLFLFYIELHSFFLPREKKNNNSLLSKRNKCKSGRKTATFFIECLNCYQCLLEKLHRCESAVLCNGWSTQFLPIEKKKLSLQNEIHRQHLQGKSQATTLKNAFVHALQCVSSDMQTEHDEKNTMHVFFSFSKFDVTYIKIKNVCVFVDSLEKWIRFIVHLFYIRKQRQCDEWLFFSFW